MPWLLSSTRNRRSEETTPRSLSITAGTNARFATRSDSRSSTSSSALRGNQSWYTVTSSLVNALLAPPCASINRSNSPGWRRVVPLNIMCSKKCASPVMPGASLRLPARTQLFIATLGMLCTGQTMILSPLASVMARTSSRPGTGDTAGSAAAVSEPTARKCEPKLLFIARSLPVPSLIKRYHNQSPHLTYFHEATTASKPQGHLSGTGWVRKAGAARDIGAAGTVRGTGKKKRREQGKLHRGAQFSEHRGSYSPFKPYTA